MDIIYVLVPLSILLLGIAVMVFFWAVKNGQFDDMESPAHKILFDEDQPSSKRTEEAGRAPNTVSDSAAKSASAAEPETTKDSKQG